MTDVTEARTTQVAHEVLALVQRSCQHDLSKMLIERITQPEALVTLTMRSLADLRAFCAADDRARVERRDRAGATTRFVEYTALYTRPGRKMLATYIVFPHSPEWLDEVEPS